MANYGYFDLSELTVSRPGAIKLALRELGLDATADQIREHARKRHGLDVSKEMIEKIRRFWIAGTQ